MRRQLISVDFWRPLRRDEFGGSIIVERSPHEYALENRDLGRRRCCAGSGAGAGSAATELDVFGGGPFEGNARVIQKDGRSYVDVEGLARITGGTLGFQGSQIVFALPGPLVRPVVPSPPSAPPEKTGFSRDFLRAGIEGMSQIREWRAAIENAVRTNNPVNDSWVSPLRRASETSIATAVSTASTDSDRKAVPLLQNQLNNMRQLSDRLVAMRKSMTFVPTDLLDNDPMDQRILACAQGLAAIAAPGGQFEDVAACH